MKGYSYFKVLFVYLKWIVYFCVFLYISDIAGQTKNNKNKSIKVQPTNAKSTKVKSTNVKAGKVGKNKKKALSKNDIDKLKVMFVAPAKENTFDLIALGTIYQGNPYKGVALIKNSQTRQIKAFKVGATIYFGAKLIEIHRNKIIFDKDNNLYFAMVGNKGAPGSSRLPPRKTRDTSNDLFEEGFERRGHNITMTSAYRDSLIKTRLKAILFQAEAAPVIQNGRISGFRILQIDKDSIFDKFGLIDEDVITAINGIPLTNVAQTIKFLHDLKDENHIEMTIERKGVPKNININVK